MRCDLESQAGLRSMDGNAISWEEKFELDTSYVDNQSFWLDLKILLTLNKVISRSGISAGEEATMPRFSGNK